MILKITIPSTFRDYYDYLPPQGIIVNESCIGKRIKVPFRKQQKIGVVTGITQHSSVAMNKLKPALEFIDDHPLITEDMLSFFSWANRYYQSPLSEILTIALPTKLRQGCSTDLPTQPVWHLTPKSKESDIAELKRSPKQQATLQTIIDLKGSLTEWQRKHFNIESSTLKNLVDKEWLSCEKQPVLPIHSSVNQPALELNEEQQIAVNKIIPSLNSFAVFLLHGITGSGKTEVYFQTLEKVLNADKQVLILVPEIGLTPQLLERFQNRFSVPIVTFHSALNDTERFNHWLWASTGQAKIIIGTRSAVFLPAPQLGLIIIDEEHDASFKQQDHPFYSARDLAIIRAQMANITIILGSATPSLESLYNAKQAKYQLLTLMARAGDAKPAAITFVDLKNQATSNGLTKQLLNKIQQHLERGNQVLLFINRRGYSPVLFCTACRWTAKCRQCDANLSVHQQQPSTHQRQLDIRSNELSLNADENASIRGVLQCHHCHSQQPIPLACENCNHIPLVPVGRGTERFEEHLIQYFPQHRIVRIDRDTTKNKNSFADIFQQIHSGEANILLGTQILAKGHHFPKVTLVGILNADYGLLSNDFRATEQLGQLLLQVAGRAGRADQIGEVIIQTHLPDHPLLQQVITEGYTAFSETLLQERKSAGLPPYSYLALFKTESKQKADGVKTLNAIKKMILSQSTVDPSLIHVLGPIPAPMEKRAGSYRAHLLIKSQQRQRLQTALTQICQQISKLKISHQIRLSLDVDPIDLY